MKKKINLAPDPPNRNLIDKFSDWANFLIKAELNKDAFPYSVLMDNVDQDFNIGTVIRNANAFGARTIFYTGRKKYDRRGCVGSHNYKNVVNLKERGDIEKTLASFRYIVALDNRISEKYTVYNIYDKSWQDFFSESRDFSKNELLLIVGSESGGISDYLLDKCSFVLEIPQYGSIPSLNVGTASGIAMSLIAQFFLSHQS